MLEAEAPDRRAVVVAHLFLLRIEPHTLPDDLLRRAVRAPDREGAFEPHRQDPLTLQLASPVAQRVTLA